MKDPEISCEVTVFQDDKYRALAMVNFENPGETPLQIETRHVFLDGTIRSNNFKILLDGKAVPYTGRKIKRRPSGFDDYISIAPGGQIAFQVDLGLAYKLEEKVGQLQVHYSCINSERDSDSLVNIKSPVVEMKLERDPSS